MKVVALLSGGLDCIAYLGQYLDHEIYPIVFNYGQKAIGEIHAAHHVINLLGLRYPKTVNLCSLQDIWNGAQLVDNNIKVLKDYDQSVIVPLRNSILLTISVAYAKSIGADRVIMGAHTDDTQLLNNEFLYPDCDSRFHEELETVLQHGHIKNSKKVEIWSPNREGWNKVELCKKGYEKLGDLLFDTWSCRNGEDHHCGKCETCLARQDTFKKANIKDKTYYLK